MATRRLVLRPSYDADGDRGFEIQRDWEVTRMLRMASYPPDLTEVRRWFADHEREWSAGEAYRFAVDLDGRMVGLVDVDGIADGVGSQGYWLERRVWGHGYGFEAAQAITRFAFEVVRLWKLKSSHAEDNPGSARILARLGFWPVGEVRCFRARAARTSCSAATSFFWLGCRRT
jgi:RimJ/RimL family protein N-acetyltransferase